MKPLKSSLIALFLLLAVAAKTSAQQSIADSLGRLYVSAKAAGNSIIVDQGGWKALFRRDGRPATAFEYRDIRPGFGSDFLVRRDGGYFPVDSAGRPRGALNSMFVRKDSVRRMYIVSENSNLVYYDSAGNVIATVYTNSSGAAQSRLHVRTDPGQRLRGVVDSLYREVLPVIYDGPVHVTADGIVAMSGDTAYAFDPRGRLRFHIRAHDCRMLPHGVVAIQRYGRWGLRDSNGRALTPFKYYSVEEHQSDRHIRIGSSLLSYTGKEIAANNFSYALPGTGGWYVVHYNNLNGAEIRDEHDEIVFSGKEFMRHTFIGARFLHFYRDYNDRLPRIYDRSTRQFTTHLVESAIDSEAYVLYVAASKERKILKGHKILTLPRFTSISREKNAAFFRIMDEGAAARGFMVTASDQEYEMDLSGRTATKSRAGLLDSNLRLIVPLKASRIDILSRSLIYAYIPEDSAGYLYSAAGGVVLRIPAARDVRRDHAVIRATSASGVLITDTLGNPVYRGAEQPQLLFADARSDNWSEVQAQLPALLLYDDSTGYSGLYDLQGRQLLPHRYYAIAQRVPGLFTLKGGDSVYFANTRGRLMFGGRGFSGKNYRVLEGYAVVLQNAAGKWGVIDAEGREQVSFEYDSLIDWMPHTLPRTYLLAGRAGFALIDNTGRLQYAPQSWKPQRILAPGYYLGSDDKYYQAIQGEAVAVSPEQHWRTLGPGKETYSWDRFREVPPGSGLPAGIYNLAMQRIAPWYPGFQYRKLMNAIAVTDSARRKVSLIDTSGRPLIPYIDNPAALLLGEQAVVALYRDRSDLLFEPYATKPAVRIRVDSADRQQFLQDRQAININNLGPIRFTDAAGVQGVVSYKGAAFTDLRIDRILASNYAWRVRRNGRWGLISKDALDYIQPPDADSVSPETEQHEFLIFKDGLQGIYAGSYRTYLPPVYLRLFNPQSLQNGFLTVRDKAGFFMVDRRGRRITPVFDSIDVMHGEISGGKAFLAGEEVSLSIGDDAEIAVGRGRLAKVKRKGLNGYYSPVVVLQVGDKQGLYSNERFEMILEPRYDAIDQEHENGFVAWRYKADKHQGMDSTLVLDETGRVIRALKGSYNPALKRDFWYLRGEGKSPVLNSAGKLILEDGYSVTELQRNRFFIVTRGDKMGILSDSGSWIIRPRFDKIQNDYYSGGGYMTGWEQKKGTYKYALISPEGVQLTASLYDELRLGYNAALFRRGKIYGYLDERGRESIREWPERERE